MQQSSVLVVVVLVIVEVVIREIVVVVLAFPYSAGVVLRPCNNCIAFVVKGTTKDLVSMPF